MRNLNLTDITTSVGMPLKSGSLKHVQLAYREVIDYLTRSVIGNSYDNTKGYILYGCVNSGTGSSYVISEGAIFYDGEIYLVDAATFSTSGSNVPVCTITTTYYTDTDADAVEFTDSVSRSVHEIKKIVISSGASGSGTVNYSNLIPSTTQVYSTSDSANFATSAGSGTFNYANFYFRKIGDIVFLQYSIGVSISSYASGAFSFYIKLNNNLPQPEMIYNNGFDDVSGVSTYAYGTKSGYIQVSKYDYVNSLSNIISTTIYDTVTGSKIINGQIFYKSV